MFPIDTAGNDLVKCLQENTTILEILKETLHRGVDVQTIQPKSEYTGFTFALCIKVFDFRFFGFIEWVQTWMCVEQICDESKIQFGISGYEGGGSEIFSAV
jgi:hypothetical protein